MIFNYIEKNVVDSVNELNEILLSLKKSLARIELEREKVLSRNIQINDINTINAMNSTINRIEEEIKSIINYFFKGNFNISKGNYI
jgi:RNA processing factor Prp31